MLSVAPGNAYSTSESTELVDSYTTTKGAVFEDFALGTLLSCVPYYSGYSQTKWVAEMLVTTAKLKGLLVVIYRPGTISGHTKMGISNKSDFINRVICGIAQLGCYPESKAALNLAPVDYVASAIVNLGLQRESLGATFHLCSPDSLDFQLTLGWMNSWGLPLQPLPYQEWLHRLKPEKANVLWPLLSSFKDREDGFPLAENTAFSCVNCLKALQENGGGQVKDTNYIITEEVFHKYLDFFGKVGFIPSSSDGREKEK